MSNDYNYFSINHGQYIVDSGLPTSHEVFVLPTNNEFLPSNAASYSDILKFSNQQNYVLENAKVAQGKEDSVDINNNCSNIILSGEFGIGGGGTQVMTIKGHSTNINIVGTSHGNKIEIGNWSDQTYDISENITLNVTSVNGKPIMVAIGHAANVNLLGDCKKDTFSGIFISIYWWVKRIVRGILRIPVGVSGPSWL